MITVAALFSIATASTGHLRSAEPLDSEIRNILIGRNDKYRQSAEIVVGISESVGRRIISYGRLDQSDNRPLDGDTVFEIGSITKIPVIAP